MASSIRPTTSPVKRLAFQAQDETFFQAMTCRSRAYDGDPRPYLDEHYKHYSKYQASPGDNLERQVGAVQAAHNMACEVGEAYFEDM
eukprot:14368309-Heterocapsa_arctica.AAC.1